MPASNGAVTSPVMAKLKQCRIESHARADKITRLFTCVEKLREDKQKLKDQLQRDGKDIAIEVIALRQLHRSLREQIDHLEESLKAAEASIVYLKTCMS